MRIALVGARGQLGTDLGTALEGEVIALGHEEIELTRPESVASVLDAARPELVINAAAYNLVDKAEDEPEAAFAVNAFGPRNLARWCAGAEVPLVHYSTDYVFSGRTAACRTDGSRVPLAEKALPDPQSVYAASKLAGEQFVAAVCPQSLVIRTCGLYGRRKSAGKGNFIETMLRLGEERARTGQALRIVDDHLCTPTATADLAQMTARLIPTRAWGLYHATNSGATTWCGLAREIFRQAGMTVPIEPISAAQFGAKAARPEYSVLDCAKLAAAIGESPAPWQEALGSYLATRAG